MVAIVRTRLTGHRGQVAGGYPRGLVSLLGLLLSAGLVGADVPAQPATTTPTTAAASATLTITVTGVRSAAGQLTALLFLGEGGFPAKEARALRKVSVPAVQGTVSLRLTDVTPGSYAVTVYHDENGNGKLDTNWIGIPKEPVAVSNNAKGRMGPPKYKDAMFVVGGGEKALAISLIKI